MNGYIYMLEDTVNGKKYIGKHNGSNAKYWSSGLIPNRIAKKYGYERFIRTILIDGITSVNKLNELEKLYIEKFNTFIDGYNMTIGGEGGGDWILTKTNEEIQQIAESKSSKLKNRKFSESTIQKMKDSHNGKKLTPEHRANIGKAVSLREGTKHSEKTKKHLSNIKIGVPNPSHSAYMKDHNPNSQRISINGIEYKSIKFAAESLGITGRMIITRLNSKNTEYINWIRL